MESKQSASEQSSGSDTAKPVELAEKLNPETAESIEEHKPDKPDGPYVITGETLRLLIDGKPKPSRFQAISNNPLMVGLIVGIVGVSGVLIGGIITANYTYQQKVLEYNLGTKQQEQARRQSFSDEVDKLRIQKLGEVWERLDSDEFAIDELLDDSTFEGLGKEFKSNNKRAKSIVNLIHNDQAMVSKYRFWLGEKLFQKTMGYLDMNIKYTLNKLGATPEANLSELINDRKTTRQDILKIRGLFLAGEPLAKPEDHDK